MIKDVLVTYIMTSISSIKGAIDNINLRIIDSLLERKHLSLEMDHQKHIMGIPTYGSVREQTIYEELKASHPNDYEYLRPIFEAIILSSRNSK